MSRSRHPRRPRDQKRPSAFDPFEQAGGAPASGELRPEDDVVDADPTLLEEALPGPDEAAEEPEATASARPASARRRGYQMPETAPPAAPVREQGRASARSRARPGPPVPDDDAADRPARRPRDPRWADPGSEPPAGRDTPSDPFALVASRSARQEQPPKEAVTDERPAPGRAAGREQQTRATLLMLAGPEPGRAFVLGADESAFVGRASECEVAIPDLSVSRRHAELRRRPDESWEVRDAGSRNGIAVDGKTADGWVPLPSGSVLAVGDVRLRFESVRGFSQGVHSAIETVLRRSDTDQISVSPSAPLSAPEPTPPAAVLDRRVSVAAPPEPDEGRRRLSPALLKVAVGGAALLLVVIVGAVALDSGEDTPAEPPPAAGARADVDSLISEARGHVAAHRWAEAEEAYRAVLAAAPTEPEALEMIVEAPLEGRAHATLVDARAAFDDSDWARAVRTARRVPDKSRYRKDAASLLAEIEDEVIAPRLAAAEDLIDAGEGKRAIEVELQPILDVFPEHAEARALLEQARTGRRVEKPARRRPARRAHRPRPTRAPAASSEPDPIVADARRAFAADRVSDARAAAEAAADAEVAGASRLARELRAYATAVDEGDAALRGRQVAAALGHFTEALILARRITPGGGQPAGALQRRLAELHYLEGLRAADRQDVSAARRHLDKALRYDPSHTKARELLGRL